MNAGRAQAGWQQESAQVIVAPADGICRAHSQEGLPQPHQQAGQRAQGRNGSSGSVTGVTMHHLYIRGRELEWCERRLCNFWQHGVGDVAVAILMPFSS